MISLFVTNSDSSVSSKNGSQISLHLNPPVVLDPNKKWFCAVTECDIVYCFANIFAGVNDRFTYTYNGNTRIGFFPQGLYTVDAIQQRINMITATSDNDPNLFVLEADTSTSHVYVHFMKTNLTLSLAGSDNIMRNLGFTIGASLGPVTNVNDYYESDSNAQLNNIQNVLILASFINGSYYNGQTKNVLASITPDCEPASTIMYRPDKPIFVPITQNILDTITFQLVDQDYNNINLGVIDTVFDVPERWSARIIIVSEDLVK